MVSWSQIEFYLKAVMVLWTCSRQGEKLHSLPPFFSTFAACLTASHGLGRSKNTESAHTSTPSISNPSAQASRQVTVTFL